MTAIESEGKILDLKVTDKSDTPDWKQNNRNRLPFQYQARFLSFRYYLFTAPNHFSTLKSAVTTGFELTAR